MIELANNNHYAFTFHRAEKPSDLLKQPKLNVCLLMEASIASLGRNSFNKDLRLWEC